MSGNVDLSPAESVHFEKVYEAIFDLHDIHMTGQVKTMNLIQSVKDDMKNSNLTERQLKHHIEDLTRRLDPQNDDGYVSKQTFVKQGVDWMRSVTVSFLSSNRHLTGKIPNTVFLVISRKRQITIRFHLHPWPPLHHNQSLKKSRS